MSMIAAASWKLKFAKNKRGETVRILSFQYCYETGKGPGIYKCSMPDNGLLIPITLVLLERMGAIKSAVDVYNGSESLEIDGTRFETADVLRMKLEKASKMATAYNFRQLQTSMNVIQKKQKKTDNGGVDEEEDDIENVTRLNTALEELDREGGERSPLPMYTTVKNGQPLRRRLNCRDTSPVAKLFERCGYMPSKKFRVGVTSCLKFFRQNSKGEPTDGFNLESHLVQTMGHSSAIAHRHDNSNLYRRRMPANVAQPSVCHDDVAAIIEKFWIEAAFNEPKLFSKDLVKVRGPSYPWGGDVCLFLRAHSKREFPLDRQCQATGCDLKFHLYGDLRAHMAACNKGDFHCSMCSSQRIYSTYRKLRSHETSCKAYQAAFRKAEQEKKAAKLDFMNMWVCKKCGKGHAAKSILLKHTSRCDGSGGPKRKRVETESSQP